MLRMVMSLLKYLCCVGVAVLLMMVMPLCRNDHKEEILKELYPGISPDKLEVKDFKMDYKNQFIHERVCTASFKVVSKEGFYTWREETVNGIDVLHAERVPFCVDGDEVVDYKFAIIHWKFKPITEATPVDMTAWHDQNEFDEINGRQIVFLDGKPTKESLERVEGIVHECKEFLQKSKEHVEKVRGDLQPLYRRILAKITDIDLPADKDWQEMGELVGAVEQSITPLLSEYDDLGKSLLSEIKECERIKERLVPFRSMEGFSDLVEEAFSELDNHRQQISAAMASQDLKEFLTTIVIPCMMYRKTERKLLEERRKAFQEELTDLKSSNNAETKEDKLLALQSKIRSELNWIGIISSQLKKNYSILPEWQIFMNERDWKSVCADIEMHSSKFNDIIDEVSVEITELKKQSSYARLLSEARESYERREKELGEQERQLMELKQIDWRRLAADAEDKERLRLGVRFDASSAKYARSRALENCWMKFETFIVSQKSRARSLGLDISHLDDLNKGNHKEESQKRVKEMMDKLIGLKGKFDKLSQEAETILAEMKAEARKPTSLTVDTMHDKTTGNEKRSWNSSDSSRDGNQPSNKKGRIILELAE